MAVQSSDSGFSDLNLNKFPETKEELEKVHSILTNPNNIQLIEKNPLLKKAVTTFVLKLKEDREKKRSKQKQQPEAKESIFKYLISLNCISCLGTNPPNPCKKRCPKNCKGTQDQSLKGSSKSEVCTATQDSSLCDIVPSEPTTLIYSSQSGIKIASPNNDINVKDINLKFDGKGFPGCKNLNATMCQDIAKILLKNVNFNPSVFATMLLGGAQKKRLVHNMDSNDCTSKKTVFARIFPITPQSRMIIINPRKPNRARKDVCSIGVQTDECDYPDTVLHCCECSTSSDSKSNILMNPRYKSVIEVCRKMTAPGFHDYETDDFGHQSAVIKNYTSAENLEENYSSYGAASEDLGEDPISTGARFLSSVFRNAKPPGGAFNYVGPETVIEDLGDIGLDCRYTIHESVSFESVKSIRKMKRPMDETSSNSPRKIAMNAQHYGDNVSFTVPKRSSSLDDTQGIRCHYEGQFPPEISTGFSDVFNEDYHTEEEIISVLERDINYDELNSNFDDDEEKDKFDDVISQDRHRMEAKECPEFGEVKERRTLRRCNSEKCLRKGDTIGLSELDEGWGDQCSVELILKEVGDQKRSEDVVDDLKKEVKSGGGDYSHDIKPSDGYESDEERTGGGGDWVKEVPKVIEQEVDCAEKDGGQALGRWAEERERKKTRERPWRNQRRRRPSVITSSSDLLSPPPPPWKARRAAKHQHLTSKNKGRGCILM